LVQFEGKTHIEKPRKKQHPFGFDRPKGPRFEDAGILIQHRAMLHAILLHPG
jgi:hypothetical protein